MAGTEDTPQNKIDALNQAFSEVNFSTEPIENYYEFGQVLGAGKFGVVKLATSKHNSGLKFAVKIIQLEKIKSQFHSILQEILALKKIDHPNVVKLFEIYKDESKLYIVLECVEGQDLYEFVVIKRKLKESEASRIIKQLGKDTWFFKIQ